MNPVLRGLLAGASGSGPTAKLSTLIFHRVLPQPDPLFPGEVTATHFDRICSWLKAWFRVLPLDEAALALAQGRLPARALAITFDDGYADNHGVAAPLLARHGLPCTFFVATGFLDGGRMWNDTLIEAVRACKADVLDLGDIVPGLQPLPLRDTAARRLAIDTLISHCKYLEPAERLQRVEVIARRVAAQLPDDLMMSSRQVLELRRMGMQIGAHTVNHPILARLPRDAARAEIEQSRRTLESILNEPVDLFAYPNGKPGEDYLPESVELVRELQFRCAVSTQPGVSTRGTDPLQLRRFTPWDRTRLRYGARLLQNLVAAR